VATTGIKGHKVTSLAKVRSRIVGVNQPVPVLSGAKKPYIFFDNAASTPVLQEVLDCVNQFMPWYSSVHRGSGFKSQVATKAYEDAREVVGKFFGANKRDHVVIFGKNTTEAINKLSYRLGLSKDDVVIISMMEHHSNDLPWRQVATVKRIKVDSAGHLIESDLDELLAKYGNRVKLISITGGSNVTGQLTDIHRIAKKAHAVDAKIMIDAAQLAPHRQIEMKDLDDPEHLDYITISAHKMYAPFGTGALIGRRDTFESGVPELCGGGTIDLVTTGRVEWTAPPDRDEAGTPNVVGAVALAKALQTLASISMRQISAHEAELTSYALAKLNKIADIEVLGDKNPANAEFRLGVIPFKVNKLASGLAAAILSTEYGIGVRSGCFCAHPYVTGLLDLPSEDIEKFRGEVIAGDRSHMPGVIRISFGMYNTKEEIDVLASALEQIVKGNYYQNYNIDKSTGDYHAAGWEPRLDTAFSLL